MTKPSDGHAGNRPSSRPSTPTSRRPGSLPTARPSRRRRAVPTRGARLRSRLQRRPRRRRVRPRCRVDQLVTRMRDWCRRPARIPCSSSSSATWPPSSIATQRERAIKSLLVTSPAPGRRQESRRRQPRADAQRVVSSQRAPGGRRHAPPDPPPVVPRVGCAWSSGCADVRRRGGAARGVPVTSTLSLLPAGRPQLNPVGDLSSGRMARLIASAGSRFDWVIVDSPPAAGLADARIILATVDGALLVVRAGVTRFADLEACAWTHWVRNACSASCSTPSTRRNPARRLLRQLLRHRQCRVAPAVTEK